MSISEKQIEADDDKSRNLIEAAVQASIDAGLAVNGQHGVASARHAARFVVAAMRQLEPDGDEVERVAEVIAPHLRQSYFNPDTDDQAEARGFALQIARKAIAALRSKPPIGDVVRERVKRGLEAAMMAHGTNDKTYIAAEDLGSLADAAIAAVGSQSIEPPPLDPFTDTLTEEQLDEVERVAREICNGLRARPVANKWIVAAPAMIEQLLTRAALVRSPIGDDVRERMIAAFNKLRVRASFTSSEELADAAIAAIGSQSIEGERG